MIHTFCPIQRSYHTNFIQAAAELILERRLKCDKVGSKNEVGSLKSKQNTMTTDLSKLPPQKKLKYLDCTKAKEQRILDQRNRLQSTYQGRKEVSRSPNFSQTNLTTGESDLISYYLLIAGTITMDNLKDYLINRLLINLIRVSMDLGNHITASFQAGI